MTAYYRRMPTATWLARTGFIFAVILTACAPRKSPDLAGARCAGAQYGVISAGLTTDGTAHASNKIGRAHV